MQIEIFSIRQAWSEIFCFSLFNPSIKTLSRGKAYKKYVYHLKQSYIILKILPLRKKLFHGVVSQNSQHLNHCTFPWYSLLHSLWKVYILETSTKTILTNTLHQKYICTDPLQNMCLLHSFHIILTLNCGPSTRFLLSLGE